MADTVYEYTDAKGGVHRVTDIGKVPKDRIQHMLVIGADEAPAEGAEGAPPPGPNLPKPSFDSMGPQVWAVSAVLLVVGLKSKKFLLQVFCVMTAALWLLYNCWDVFLASEYSRTAEREVRKKPPVEADSEP